VRTALQMTREKMAAKWSDWIFHYGHARLDFATGNYADAKKHLLQFDIDDPVDKMNHDSLLVCIYYELQDWESFHNCASTFRRFMERNKVFSEQAREEVLNTIGLLSAMATYQSLPSKDALFRIRQKLEEATYFFHRPWLEDKVKELEKTHQEMENR
jgi:hypothetical protein